MGSKKRTSNKRVKFMAGKKFKQRKTDVIQDGIVYRLYKTIYGPRYAVYTYTDDLPARITLLDMIGDVPVSFINKRCFYRTEIQEVIIPEGLTWINDEAFAQCKNLETVSLPSTLNSVNYSCFYKCEKLKYTKYCHGLYLGNEANPYLCLVINENFGRDDETERIVIEVHPDTKVVSSTAFNNACELTVPFDTIHELILHEKLERVGGGAFCLMFGGLKKIESLYVDSIELLCRIDVGNLAKRIFVAGQEIEDTLVIPKTVTSIAYECFNGCRAKIKTVIVEGDLSEVGSRAFAWSTNINTVIFEGNIGKLGSEAFRYSDVHTVIFKGNVSGIERDTFENCEKLTIHAPAGSCVENYARENNVAFKAT